MIKDITIGQFFPGNSVIHKLDPRIKLVLTFVYIVIVFLCKNFVSLASIVVALTVVILLSKISPKLIWKSVKPIFIIIAITSLLQIFYNKDGTVLFTIGKFSLYTGGLYMAIFTTVRIICLVIASSMQLYDIQHESNDPEDIEEFNKIVTIYEKLTGNDCRHLLANFNIIGGKIDNE